MRQTHCRNGHPFAGDNLIQSPNGERRCRTCLLERQRIHRQRGMYCVWEMMVRRCRQERHPDYPRYGGRGITVCQRWTSFDEWLADMGQRPTPQHTLDRIDNSKGYEPGNCRWATRAEQRANQRRPSSHVKVYTEPLTHNGVGRSAREWERALGLSSGMVGKRLRAGWPVERAVTEPKHSRKSDGVSK